MFLEKKVLIKEVYKAAIVLTLWTSVEKLKRVPKPYMEMAWFSFRSSDKTVKHATFGGFQTPQYHCKLHKQTKHI